MRQEARKIVWIVPGTALNVTSHSKVLRCASEEDVPTPAPRTQQPRNLTPSQSKQRLPLCNGAASWENGREIKTLLLCFVVL